MDDKEVIDYLWPNKISLYKRKSIRNEISNEMLNYIKNRFVDSNSNEETLYRIKHNIYDKPLCKKCGKPISFSLSKNHGHFNNYCSRSCQIDNDKIKKAIKEKYNVDNISQLDYVKEKIKKNNFAKYGVANTFNLNKSIEKSIRTRTKNKEVWLNSIKETNVNRYRVDNVAKYNLIKERIKESNIKKYGVSSWTQTANGKETLKKIVSSKEVQEKIINTKKKNKSFNASNPEDRSYILLKEKYDDTIRQYRSEEYPFNADFYIPSIDTYIECNYHWTHGKKKYEGNLKDLEKINTWKNKNSKYYDNAIKTWTYYDVNKRNAAIKNKLNWFEFFNIDELKKWLNNYEIN